MKTNLSKQQTMKVSMTQLHQDNLEKDCMQSFFSLKCQRPEPMINDTEEKERQDSPEMRRWSVVSSTSGSTVVIAFTIFSHDTADVIVPGA